MITFRSNRPPSSLFGLRFPPTFHFAPILFSIACNSNSQSRSFNRKRSLRAHFELDQSKVIESISAKTNRSIDLISFSFAAQSNRFTNSFALFILSIWSPLPVLLFYLFLHLYLRRIFLLPWFFRRLPGRVCFIVEDLRFIDRIVPNRSSIARPLEKWDVAKSIGALLERSFVTVWPMIRTLLLDAAFQLFASCSLINSHLLPFDPCLFLSLPLHITWRSISFYPSALLDLFRRNH